MAFPPNFTNTWDTTFPADTELANLLGANLRQLRVDVMQRLSLLSGTLANRPTPEILNATWGGAGYGLLYFSTDTNQVFQWNGAAWVDVSASVGKVSVVAVDLVAQQANIGPILLVTPAANGWYRSDIFIVLTRAATTSSVLPVGSILFTDADSSTPQTIVMTATNSSNTVGAGGSGGFVASGFYAKAGAPIQYSTTAYNSVGATSMQYSIHIRLEGPF